MKRILLFLLKALLVLGGAAVCIAFYLYTIGFFDLSPAVGLLPAPSGKAYLDSAALQTALEEQGVALLEAQPDEDREQAAARLLEQGARMLIVAQDDAAVSAALLQRAQTAGAAVLFVGQSPEASALAVGENVWYLGSLAAYGGELLGHAMAMDYRDGLTADANGDHLLQYYLYQSEDTPDQRQLAAYALEESEHYGVYTAPVSYTGGDGAPLAFDAEALAGQTPPEAILCTNAQDARAALAVAAALGWLDSEQPVRVYAAADTPQQADELVSEGVRAAAFYDPAAIAGAAAQMALNALEFQFVGLDTGLAPDAEGRFLLPYGLCQA